MGLRQWLAESRQVESIRRADRHRRRQVGQSSFILNGWRAGQPCRLMLVRDAQVPQGDQGWPVSKQGGVDGRGVGINAFVHGLTGARRRDHGRVNGFRPGESK